MVKKTNKAWETILATWGGPAKVTEEKATPATVEATSPAIETPKIEPKMEVAPPSVPTAKEARESTIVATQESQEETQEKADKIEEESKVRLEEETKREKDRIKEIEDFRKEQEELIKEKDSQIASAQREVDVISQKRKTRDLDLIQWEAKRAKELSEQEIALSKRKTDEALFETKREIEMNAQRSAMSFNKLWLWFSSWIVLQSQAIADRGSLKLATLKAQAAYNQADLNLKASKIQNSYASLTNQTIDKYTDIQLKNKRDVISRINSTKNNLKLNAEQKRVEINKIKDEYVSFKRSNEDNLKKEQERLADRAITQANQLEESINKDRNAKLTKMNQDFATWTVANMTPTDIADLERNLWLTPWSVDRKFNWTISSLIRKQFDSFIWSDYSVSNMNELIEEARDEMVQGKSMDEAIVDVMSRELKTNEEYLRQQNLKKKLDKAKLKKASGTWGWISKAELAKRSAEIYARGGGLISTAWAKILAYGTDTDTELLMAQKQIEKEKEEAAKKEKKKSPELSEWAKDLLARKGKGFWDLDESDVDLMIERVKKDWFSDREALEQISMNTNLELKESIDKKWTIKIEIKDPDLIKDDTLKTLVISNK